MSTRTKTPIGVAWVDEHGILWHRLDQGIRITASDAAETARTIAELLQGRPAPAIVDIGDMLHASPEARQVFANLGKSATELATAILVRPDANPASAIQSFLFSKQSPDRPTAIFEDEGAAVAWARTFVPVT